MARTVVCPHCQGVDFRGAQILADVYRWGKNRNSFTSPEVAKRFGLSPSGASNVCRVLAKLGVAPALPGRRRNMEYVVNHAAPVACP